MTVMRMMMRMMVMMMMVMVMMIHDEGDDDDADDGDEDDPNWKDDYCLLYCYHYLSSSSSPSSPSTYHHPHAYSSPSSSPSYPIYIYTDTPICEWPMSPSTPSHTSKTTWTWPLLNTSCGDTEVVEYMLWWRRWVMNEWRLWQLLWYMMMMIIEMNVVASIGDEWVEIVTFDLIQDVDIYQYHLSSPPSPLSVSSVSQQQLHSINHLQSTLIFYPWPLSSPSS